MNITQIIPGIFMMLPSPLLLQTALKKRVSLIALMYFNQELVLLTIELKKFLENIFMETNH